MVRPIRFSLMVCSLAVAQSAFADNLVFNPDFTRLFSGWASQPESSGSIGADFSHGMPSAPSAQVSGTQDSPTGTNVSSCIEIDDAANVDFVFNVLVVAGSAQGEVAAYSDTACTQSIGLISTESTPPSTEWTTLSLIDAPLPAGARSVAIKLLANNIPDGTSPGTPGDAYFDHVAFGPTGTLPTAIPINQHGLTGAWYAPVSSGQGFQFSIVPNVDVTSGGALFGAWYTYDLVAGGTDTQRWYSLQASLADGARSADVTIYQNTGGNFAGPPSTTAAAVGTGTLAFDSCNSGTFDYTLDDGRTGSIPLQTLLPTLECAETGTPDVMPGVPALSGAWYDPATSGQGVLINVNDFIGEVFVGWYTYAPDGAASGAAGQRWFSAQGGIGPGVPISLAVYESTGGAFDSDGAAITMQVGTATLTFASCESATLDYTFTDGDLAGRNGTLELARLDMTPTDCETP